MPAFPIRGRHFTSLVGVVLAVAVLTGCPYQRDPGSYGDGVRTSFVEGCDGSAFEGDDTEPGAEADAQAVAATSLPTAQCVCMYEEIEANIDFDRFSDVYSEQRETPATLPTDFQEAVAPCQPDGTVDNGDATATTEAADGAGDDTETTETTETTGG
ncbi:hypothetical protein BH23ACT2_BH23ACT2_25190 [soil metagenome]